MSFEVNTGIWLKIHELASDLVERETHAKDANDDHVPAVDSHQHGHLPRLVAVGQADVEEGGEDEVEAGDGGGADQVDDHPEEGDREGDGQEEGDHEASEGNSLPTKGWQENCQRLSFVTIFFWKYLTYRLQ